MAATSSSSSTSTSSSIDNDDNSDWYLARQGIQLLINNNYKEAETLFLTHTDSLVLYSGYSYATFMNALMTLEDDKLNLATNILNDLEKRCNNQTGWLKTIKNKITHENNKNNNYNNNYNLIDNLETQIILADSQVCLAILIILQAEFSGYIKGGWVLRKSWKIYQNVYREILQLYRQTADDLQGIPQSPSSCSSSNDENSPKNGCRKLPSSQSAFLTQITNSNGGCLKKSLSVNYALSKGEHQDTKQQSWTARLKPFTNSLPLSYLTTFNWTTSSSSTSSAKNTKFDRQSIQRLMGAVCFGYGLFQLGVSLLPPSLLKITNLLGFGGNRQKGIDCLMFARLGADMRAPLATLTLLWYHTIVRPFYALDGHNVQAGVEAACQLIQESEAEYKESALFLFFKGRVNRLQSNIPAAIDSFQKSVENANQREIKILSLHEVGWCYVIELDFESAESIFMYLKTKSRWSHGFYMYVSAICTGANGNFTKSYNRHEIYTNMISGQRGNQLEEFLMKRVRYFPENYENLQQLPNVYFRLLIYEMLYLWNALPSCNSENIAKIIEDCCIPLDGLSKSEPMKGLSRLILGCCHCLQQQYDKSIVDFKECLQIRHATTTTGSQHDNIDDHISAFAQYELGVLLIRNVETRDEGKLLLQQISGNYKNYDFEHRLNVRVHSILKTL